MAIVNYVGSNSFLKGVFQRTILEDASFSYDCVEKKIREIGTNVINVFTKMRNDVKANARTFMYLDAQNIAALSNYAENLDEVLSLSGKSLSISADAVKQAIKSAVPRKSINVDILQSARKNIKAGSNIDAAVSQAIAGKGLVKKEVLTALADYEYYSSHKNTVNKDGNGKVIGSDAYILSCAERVYGSQYAHHYNIHEIKRSNKDWIISDLRGIVEYISSEVRKAGQGEVDVERLRTLSKQINKFINNKAIDNALDAYAKKTSDKDKEHSSIIDNNALVMASDSSPSMFLKAVTRHLELSERYLKDKGYGVYEDDEKTILKGSYPHYAGDKGITFGYGHYVKYDYDDAFSMSLIDKYVPKGTPRFSSERKIIPDSTLIPVDFMEAMLEDDLTHQKKTLIYKLGEEGVIIDEAELEALTVYRFKKGELGSTLTILLKNDTIKGKTTSRDRATYASAFGSDERGRICTDMLFKVLGYSPSDTDATITARLEEY